jgi:hypothetical protein
MSTVTLHLSTPLDTLDGPLQIVLHWVEAQRRGLELAVVAPPASQSTLAWLNLLAFDRAGTGVSPLAPSEVPWTFPDFRVEGPSLAEVRSRGVLAEMLLAYLVQLAWTPDQAPECRPLSEVVKFFEAPKESRLRPFAWEELLNINATRLQELTPRELVEAATAFGSLDAGEDGMLLEAWALLFVEHCQTLVDVARHLSKFWFTPEQPVALDLPSDWYEQMENGELTLESDQESHLLLALTGEDLGESAVILALLGSERCRQRVIIKETSTS